ncbi:MAG TPA: hypothetical protein VF058_03555 [Actinomycetota bacterium]
MESRRAIVVGLVVVVAFTVFLVLLAEGAYDTWAAVLLAPLLVGVSLPALSRQALREGDRTVFWILVTALILKLGGAIARHFVAFDVYEGGADAAAYDEWGVQISDRFRDGDFTTGLESLSGTNFIRFLTGVVYTVIGPSTLGGFLVYSWLGYWGLYFFYRAFVVAVPTGRSRSYAKVMFFLPSLLYWPSSVGKEAWMMFTLGIAAFGIARMLSGEVGAGARWAIPGLWLASLVRPHVAGLMGIGLLVAFLVRRQDRSLREVAPIAKGVSLIVLALAAAVLVVKADAFLKDQGIDTSGGVTSTIGQVTERTGQGDSEFSPSIVQSPQRAPIAVATVLFRPLPFEAHNAQALMASLESVFLLGFCLWRFRWGLAALRGFRDSPYLAFAMVYVGLFIFAFSGIANFGLLARERVQLLPLFLALFFVPPRDRSIGGRRREEATQSLRPSA